jgi:aminoglycoside phosphotransferase (APT) family kinase protein
MSDTFLLDLADSPGQAVCKIGSPSVRTGDVIEPLVVRLVGRTTNLPVPTVLDEGLVRVGSGSPRRWALYEFREGSPPTPFDELHESVRERVVREVGSALGRLHETEQFDRIGGLGRNGDSLVVTDPNGLHLPAKARSLLDVATREEGLDREPVLAHGDLFPSNILIANDGSITALVDWGNAHVTTAGYSLARAEMRFVDWFRFPGKERARLREALRDGYREHRSLPSDYPRFARTYKSLWLFQSGERLVRHTGSRRGRRQLIDHAGSLL